MENRDHEHTIPTPRTPSPCPFHDRADAGRQLATRLRGVVSDPVLVVGISASGITVAYETARSLHALLEGWDDTQAQRHRTSMRNHTVVLVDDGLASAPTMRAAIGAIRQEKPHRLLVGLPIATEAVLSHVDPYVDGIVCLHEGSTVPAIRAAYADTNAPAEVGSLVDRRRHEHESLRPPPPAHR